MPNHLITCSFLIVQLFTFVVPYPIYIKIDMLLFFWFSLLNLSPHLKWFESYSLGLPAKNSNCWQGIRHGPWLYISRANGTLLYLSVWTCLPCRMPDCPCDSLYSWDPCKYTTFFLIFVISLWLFHVMLLESLLFSAVSAIIIIKTNKFFASK